MADNDLIRQALSRGYSIDEIADRLSEDSGMSSADIRSRGYSSQEIIGTLGYSIPEVKQSMLDRAKNAVNWNKGRDINVPEGQTVTDDSFSAGIPDIQNEKPKRNILMENSIMRNSNGTPATEQTADLSSLPSVQKISTPSLQFERQKESNRKWLDNSKPLVVDQLMRDNNLSAEDAEIEFSRMRNAGVVPKATESGLREATWGEAFNAGIAKVKPSFDKSMAGLAAMKADMTGDFELANVADALRKEANDQLAAAEGVLAGTSKDSWKKTISDAPASLAQNLPTVIAASALASNPALAGVIGNIGLAGMGLMSGGASYSEGKDAGLNASNNLQQSALKAMAEVIPEKMSLSVLTNALGKKAAEQAMKDSILQSAKTLGKYIGSEIGTEELTTIAQFGVDKMYSKPGMPMKELVSQMIDTAKATLIQAPILGGAGILSKAAVDNAGRIIDPVGYQLRGFEDAVDRTNFVPLQGGAENFDGYEQRMAEVAANPFGTRLTRIAQAEQTKAAAQQAIATAPTVDAAVDAFNVATAAGSSSMVDQSQLLNDVNGVTNASIAAPLDTQETQANDAQVGAEQAAAPTGEVNAQTLQAPTQAEQAGVQAQGVDSQPANVQQTENVPNATAVGDVVAAPLTQRMRGSTVSDLLIISKTHRNADVRDAAQAELKRRETEYAYSQNAISDDQKARQILDEKADQDIAQAEAINNQPEVTNALQAALKRAGVQPSPVAEQGAPSPTAQAPARVANGAQFTKDGGLHILGDVDEIRAELAEYGFRNVGTKYKNGLLVFKNLAKTVNQRLIQADDDAVAPKKVASPVVEQKPVAEPVAKKEKPAAVNAEKAVKSDFSMADQTNEEAAAEQAEANKHEAEPPAKNVTVDQVDIFNEQGGLRFSKAAQQFDEAKLTKATFEEGDNRFETGVPVTFKYLHNKQSATKLFGIPDKDSPYDRGYEPSGKYVTITDGERFAADNPKQFESGILTFENPLVLSDKNWKRELSAAFGGLTGKRLSQAVIAAGYDGVVTIGKYGTSETLDLTSFDARKAKYSKLSSSGKPIESEALPQQTAERLIARELGSTTLAKVLVDSGIVSFVNRGSEFQGATYENGNIILNLDALTEDNFDGVLAHEGFHSTVRELVGEETWNQLMSQLEQNLKAAKGNDWVTRANAAIPADTKASDRTEEIGAYAIEQVTNGEKVPNFIKRWVDSLLSAIRTALIRGMGGDKAKLWAMKNLKPQDLANLAIAGLKAKARNELASQGRAAMAYSTAFGSESQHRTPLGDVTEIDVDGVKRPALNSNGKPIHWSREGIENFWRWAGDSVLADSLGQPVVYYHGSKTPQNLTEFVPGGKDGSRLTGDAYGVGSYFTTSPNEASATVYTGEDGAVFQVYVRGNLLNLGGDLTTEQAAALTKLANDVMLPSDKARFQLGRKTREFDDVHDARDFFDNQRKNWQQFGDGMDRAKPEARADGGKYQVDYTDFDAQIDITTGEEADTLLRAIGFDNAMAAGFDGIVMNKSGGQKWAVIYRPDGNVKSATGNTGDFDGSNPDIRYSKASPSQEHAVKLAIDRAIAMEQGKEVAPIRRESALLKLRSLRNKLDEGKITAGAFIFEVNQLHQSLENASAAKKFAPEKERARGADYIRQKLLEAKRRGDISEETADMTEWFVLQNPALVDDLGISIRTASDAEQGSRGRYMPATRVMRLFKENAATETGVHEILHHLERMMPEEMRAAIRKEYAKRVADAYKLATKNGNKDIVQFIDLVNEFAVSGKAKTADAALKLITDGKVPYQFYQLFNTSEFWAVNGAELMSNRFAAKDSVFGKIRQWFKEFVQKAKSILGIKSDAAIIRAMDGLLAGDGEFVSKDMLAMTDKFFAVGGQRNAFSLPEWTKADTVQERIQDRYNRIRDVVKAIRSQGLVSDLNNFDMGEDRFHGVAMAKIEAIEEDVLSLLKAAKAADITLEEATMYAYAEHAPERNKAMQAINPNVQTGSGMSDQEAADIIAKAKQEGKDAALSQIADNMRAIARRTLKAQLDAGLIEQSEYDNYTNKYQKWVPLRGFETIDEQGRTFRGTGKGFNIRGKENLRALGRDSKAGQILENIVMDAERTAIRSTKNVEVNHRFLRFVLDNPDPTLWEIDATKTKQALKNGRVSLDSLIDKGDNTIGVKVNGQVVYVKIHDQKLFEQLANMWDDSEFGAIPYLGEFSRYLSKSYTAWSPEFALYTNPIRDIQAAVFSITGREGVGMTKNFVKAYPKALQMAYQAEALGKDDPLYAEYKAMGGKTGFWNHNTLETKVKEIESLVKDMEASPGKNPLRYSFKMLKSLETLISNQAGAFENATRFAAYIAMRDAGRSKQDAAAFAKNLNVNFNRRGTWSAGIGSVVLFFNPAIQGIHNQYETLVKGKHKKQAWALMAAHFGAMAALAMLNAAGGEDDDGVKWWDKIPDYEKERNVILVLPSYMKTIGDKIPDSTGRYLKIPMPYQWNIGGYAGTLMADSYRNSENPAEGTSLGKAALLLSKATATAYMPVTGLPPTIAPIYHHVANKKPIGEGQLYPDSQFNKHKPDSEKYSARMKDTPWQQWAEFVNEATGGNKFKEGLISIPPAVWKNYVRNYLGGPMSFANGIYDAVNDADVTKAPFIRKAYGEVDFADDADKFYGSTKKPVEAAKAYKDALKSDPAYARTMRTTEAVMIRLGNMALNSQERLGAISKDDIRIKDRTDLSDSEKRLKLKMNDLKRSNIQEEYLKEQKRVLGAAAVN